MHLFDDIPQNEYLFGGGPPSFLESPCFSRCALSALSCMRWIMILLYTLLAIGSLTVLQVPFLRNIDDVVFCPSVGDSFAIPEVVEQW